MNSSWTDLGAYFDDLWREVNYGEVCEPEPLDGKVRLDCSGELVDAGSLGVALVRHATAGLHIEFVCPRCRALHDSARFV
ncbi:MAG TPA: hypothetical protein VFU28_17700 [Vicinamibacterales bacterium]|nr:hypothetical protein [Vicinamibacterales bacterium]